jgi:hypothetical protein
VQTYDAMLVETYYERKEDARGNAEPPIKNMRYVSSSDSNSEDIFFTNKIRRPLDSPSIEASCYIGGDDDEEYFEEE